MRYLFSYHASFADIPKRYCVIEAPHLGATKDVATALDLVYEGEEGDGMHGEAVWKDALEIQVNKEGKLKIGPNSSQFQSVEFITTREVPTSER